MSLPKIGTDGWEKEIAFYMKASPDAIRRRAKQLNIKDNTYREEMLDRGVRRRVISKSQEPLNVQIDPGSSQDTLSHDEKIIINLPPVVLREFRDTSKNSEEIAGLHMSDGHAGKITKSYDEDVYRSRMDAIFDSTMDIVTKHRKMYKISKLWVPNTGDNIQGENAFQGSKIGGVKIGVRDQLAKVAFPAWVRLIASFKQEFEEVRLDGFAGNHGWSKLAPDTSKEDYRLYDMLQAYFSSTKGITIQIHDKDFGDIVNIFGFRFFCFHGDGIPSHQGVPLIALDRRITKWHMQYGGFNYALSGHFHKFHIDELSSKCTYMMCSTLVSDDDWALKYLGISSNPSQNLFGIHPKRGLTWKYTLCVDDKFIPQKIEQENANVFNNVEE